jgi:hypothetical protein
MSNPFSSMTDEVFNAAMFAAVSNQETLKLWAEESQRRQDALKAKVIAAETATIAAKTTGVIPTGKPCFTRHGVPCLIWYGKKTDKNPTGEKIQVDRHCVVLTLPVTKEETTEKTTNGKTTKTTSTVKYGPAILMWVKQLVTVNPKSGVPMITPFDNYWFPSGSNKTLDPKNCEALRAIETVSDVHECWLQETEHTELNPAKARQVTPAEFKRIAAETILTWHKTHGKG